MVGGPESSPVKVAIEVVLLAGVSNHQELQGNDSWVSCLEQSFVANFG